MSSFPYLQQLSHWSVYGLSF